MTKPDPHPETSTVGEGAVPKLALVTPSVDSVAGEAVAVPSEQALQQSLDRLSLTQALLDVEVANARVLDLTARLVEANRRADALRVDVDASRAEAALVRAQADAEVAQVRAEMAAHQAYLDEQRSSGAYRWAAKVWNLRNALRG